MEGVEDLLPTTPAQSGMVFESLANPESCVNLGLMTAVLPADLDIARYQAAWATCVTRHQSLRSHFLWEGLTAPVQIIREEAAPKWEMLDWRQADAAMQSATLESWRRTGLPLDKAPVVRLALAQLDEGYMLIWACHHAVLDDWSMDLILGEVERIYAGGTLPDPMAFRDYADWLAERDEDSDTAFWEARFDGLETPSRVAFEGTTPSPNNHAAHVSEQLTLTAEQTQAISDIARALRVTIGAVLTTIWGCVVGRLSDSSDVTFGLATTQRAAELDGAQSAVGNFVATLPLRAIATPGETLRERIVKRAEQALEEQGRAAPMLADLLDRADSSSAQAPFDTILSLKETGLSGYVHQMHRAQVVHYHSSFALAMIIRPGPPLSLTVLADPHRMDDAARAQILAMTKAALCAAPAALDVPATDLPMIDGDPQPMVGAPLPDRIPLLPDMIRAHDPQSIALSDGNVRLNYGALEQLVQAYAAQLSANGAKPGDRIGVLLPRGAQAIAGFLAAWRIGASYVPLDPAQPEARLRDMVQAGAVHSTLCSAEYAHVPETPLIADPAFEGPVPQYQTRAQDTAYVMFTSGSTGTPKGVVISHGNLAASTAARPIWYADTPDRYLVVSPFGFDSSVAGIYWTLSQGGTLIVPPAETVQDPKALCALIAAEQITHTLCLPSLYGLILDAASSDQLNSLRCTIVAGEACPEQLVARHHQERSGTRLINEYGPTEATVWCVAAELRDAAGPVPIGKAIPGVTLTLRDSLGRPVPDGLPGLLCVSGPGVSAGYYNDPGATAAAFFSENGATLYNTGDLVRRRPDGQLLYLGRQDDQVKIRGQRIELGEVEARLQGLPGVTSAVVVAVPQAGRMTLVAYLQGPAKADEIHPLIRDTLTGPYRPAHIVVGQELPQTATGKVNRQALCTIGIPQSQGTLAAPQGATETKLAGLWQELLDLPATPDVETDFFALGGDSLSAMRLVGEVSDAFAHPMRVVDMMRSGLTVRSMAGLLGTQATATQVAAATWPAPANASQKAMWLAARMNPGQPFFHLTLAAQLPGSITRDTLEQARDAMAMRHDVLRCRFHLRDRVLSLMDDAPDAPVTLAKADAETLEAQLQAALSEPFDMSTGALWRINAWQIGSETTAVQLVVHHTICDGWSLDVIMQDLVAALRETPLADPAPTNSFADFLTLDPEPSDETRAFWSAILSDLPETLVHIPMDHPLPARADPKGHLLRHLLPADISQRLKTFAATQETSVFTLLWAGLGHTLYDLTGTPSSLVAVSQANRPSAAFHRTVGCFTKALPYPLTCTPGNFITTLQTARKTARDIMLHEDIGPENLELPAGTGGPGYLSSFSQIALQYNDFDWTKGMDPEVQPIGFDPTNTSVFEISIAWSWRGSQLEAAMLARAELFERESLVHWLKAYADTLADAVRG